MKSFCVAIFLAFCCVTSFAQQSGYVRVSNGDSIYYECAGHGEPVVLLHGHTLDGRMWAPQIKVLLDAGYRVIVPELRGYGHSSPQREGVSFAHSDDVVTLFDSLRLEKTHLVGLSMGSFVASEVVALHSDRLLSATLASGNLKKGKGPEEPLDSVEMAQSVAEIEKVKAKGVDNWKKEWIEKLIQGGGSQAEQIRQSLTQQVMEWDAFQILHPVGHVYYGDRAWDSLKTRMPALPVLILSGETEHKKVPNGMLKYLPGGRQEVIMDCGHMSNMERPEVFNRLLLELLASSRR